MRNKECKAKVTVTWTPSYSIRTCLDRVISFPPRTDRGSKQTLHPAYLVFPPCVMISSTTDADSNGIARVHSVSSTPFVFSGEFRGFLKFLLL